MDDKLYIITQTPKFSIDDKTKSYEKPKLGNFVGLGESNIKKFNKSEDENVITYCEAQSNLLNEMYKKPGYVRSISDDLAIIQSATIFLDSLPLANDLYWANKNLSQEEMQKMANSLKLAISVFNQSAHGVIGYKGEYKIQQFYNTAAAAYLLMFKLTKLQYPEQYKNYGLNLKMFEDLLNNPLNAVCDDHVIVRANQILQVIKDINQDVKEGVLFNFNMDQFKWAEQADSKFIVNNMETCIVKSGLDNFVEYKLGENQRMSGTQKKAWLFLNAQRRDEIKEFEKHNMYTNVLDPNLSPEKVTFIDRYFDLKYCARSLWTLFASTQKERVHPPQYVFIMRVSSDLRSVTCDGFIIDFFRNLI